MYKLIQYAFLEINDNKNDKYFDKKGNISYILICINDGKTP